MSFDDKVIWSEGMFIRAQHFQQEARHVERQLRARTRALVPYGWGLTELRLNRELLSIGQFAVEPSLQGAGVGSTLLGFVEALASVKGVRELALDTSEHAQHLIRYYASRGYRFVEFARWEEVNYRSVILAKTLADAEGAG